MSEQEPEADAWGTPEDGWSGDDRPGTDLAEIETVDGEPVDDAEPPEPEIIDGEVVGETWQGTGLEPWKITDDPNDWAKPDEPEPLPQSEHGQRPGGGSHGGMKGDGAGSGAGTSKTRSKNPFRRKKTSGSGGSGGGDFVLYKKQVNKTTNASVVDNRNAAVIKTAPVNSGNTAGWNVAGGRRPPAGKRR